MNRIKKVLALVFLLNLCFNVMSCSKININSSGDFVLPPKLDGQYINGVWRVTDVQILDKNLCGRKDKSELMNISISFCDSMATIGSNTLMDPKTKLKKLKKDYSNHYLLYNYDIDFNSLNIKDKSVINVISVYQNNTMFCEVIASDNMNAYIFHHGVLYKVVKISDMNYKLPDIKNDNNQKKANVDEYSSSNSYNSSTGVLIGLKGSRYKDDSTNELKQDYRTLWISFSDNKLNPVLEKKDLFVPRLKGFTVLSVNQNHTLSGNSREEITYTNIVNGSKEKSEKNVNNDNCVDIADSMPNSMKDTRQRYMDILFVSNDYFSAQYYEGYSFAGDYEQLKTLPLDNPNLSTGISIDILGKNALKSYEECIKAINSQYKKSYKVNPESFGMVRKNGYWALIARGSDDKSYHNSDLNLLPTKKLIMYDRLCVGWSVIKDRVPNALDVVTSPTSRIAIVMTSNKLLVYEIKNGELNREPLQTITLKDGESMVMAEWASNEFTDYWSKAFKSHGSYKEITNED